MRLAFWKKKKAKWPEIPFEEIRKRAKLLVVDDADFPYLALFKRDKYTIEHWRDIESLPSIERGDFDVVLLDINGVGRKHSADEGLGILRHLKADFPAQIVIAYSNNDWPLSTREFFDKADATLDKRADYVVFRETIDRQLRRRFSLEYYLDVIGLVSRARGDRATELRHIAEEAILSRDAEAFRNQIGNWGMSTEQVTLAATLVQTAISIFQMFVK